MRRFARRLSPFLTIYLLIVSLGLPLHKVYCACLDVTDFSLFAGDHQCKLNEEAILAEEIAKLGELAKFECCRKKAIESCKARIENGEKVIDQDHDCGNEETVLAKLTADYPIQKIADVSQLVHWPTIVPESPALDQAFVAMVPKALPIRGPDPPPLPYGRTLLVRQQLFLC